MKQTLALALVFTFPFSLSFAMCAQASSGLNSLVQEAYLKASNSGSQDLLGTSVAISGDTLVVGAPGEASAATGVNGNQNGDSAPESGAAYVFVRSAGAWVQEAYLKPSNTGAGDNFGFAVSIDGNTIVVGAKGESSNSTGVNGSQGNGASFSGAAYVFERTGGTWTQAAYLKASNTNPQDQFGFAVDVDGDSIVVGASRESSDATGVNGNQNNNAAPMAGAAYVFVRNGASWVQQAYVKASNAEAFDSFGGSVAIEGDTLAIGASGEDGRSTGVDGNQGDNSASRSGAVYVYTRSSGIWSSQSYLKASNTERDDLFGDNVALSGDTVVVGAFQEDARVVGIDGDGSDNGSLSSGAAYIFRRSGAVWSQEAYLKASNTGGGDWFGRSVAVEGDTAIVGAWQEYSRASGVDGNQANNAAPAAGASYVFRRSAGGWSQEAYLKASNTEQDDRFGRAVALSGNTFVVCAYHEDSDGNGVGSTQADNSALWSGASYVFTLADSPGTSFCFGDGTGSACPCGASGGAGEGCMNSSQGTGATLVGSGLPSLNNDSFQLAASGLPSVAPGVILRGATPLNGGFGNPVGDGLLCVGGQVARSQVQNASGGSMTFTLFQGSGFGASSYGVGIPTHYQLWYRDPLNACTGAGFNYSNAWTTTWMP